MKIGDMVYLIQVVGMGRWSIGSRDERAISFDDDTVVVPSPDWQHESRPVFAVRHIPSELPNYGTFAFDSASERNVVLMAWQTQSNVKEIERELRMRERVMAHRKEVAAKAEVKESIWESA